MDLTEFAEREIGAQRAAANETSNQWQEWEENVPGKPALYVRFILGPDTEDAWLCLRDGEPDMHDLATFSSHTLARRFLKAAAFN